ncbi:MAG: hypothetical protein CVU98_05980 [Firmicutes bacterium HGW-Firmicutes-3]|jgi:uncharacterized membrane protein YjjP (DUF1212 family)|nr:MAG: hypothetical protein CVU98_05980 [Firmicutes bacterium HGW-Firmicutes-3]
MLRYFERREIKKVKILVILTLLMLIITFACGMLIRYSGDSFQNAISGHMVLGVITIISQYDKKYNSLKMPYDFKYNFQ